MSAVEEEAARVRGGKKAQRSRQTVVQKSEGRDCRQRSKRSNSEASCCNSNKKYMINGLSVGFVVS